jgi:ATP-dependent RNA helicase DeaD
LDNFKALGLEDRLVERVEEIGFTSPTKIQEKVILSAFTEATDIIAIAHTGTGKTAAFSLPIIQMVDTRNDFTQAIILAPTRELVQQVHKEIRIFAKSHPLLKIEAVYGGTPVHAQIKSIKKNVPHIIVATPGRIIDLLNRKAVKLDKVAYVVLDEADEMLNMGFLDDMKDILSFTPKEKLIWLFSATMPKAIRKLANDYLKEPKEFNVRQEKLINTNIEHLYLKAGSSTKINVLLRFLSTQEDFYGIIFCKTRKDTTVLAQRLKDEGLNAEALNGELKQTQRDQVMNRFRKHINKILIATDIAARGLDVDDISAIVHYSLPDDLENYTHRSGRTARAGKKGISVSILSGRDVHKYEHITRQIGIKSKAFDLPSDKTMFLRRLEKWKQHIADQNANLVSDEALKLAESVFGDMSKQDLVNIILTQYFKGHKNLITATKDHNTPERTSKRKVSASSNDKDLVQMFINIGRSDSMNAKSLTDFIIRRTKLNFNDLIDLQLHKRHSTFKVSPDKVFTIDKMMKGQNVKGRMVLTKVDKKVD